METQVIDDTKDYQNNLYALQALANQTQRIIFVKNKEGRFTLMNQAGTRLLGLTQEEVIGKTEADLFGPMAGIESWESDHQVLVAGRPVTVAINWQIHGQEKTLEIVKHPFQGQSGQIQGILGIGHILASDAAVKKPMPPRAEQPRPARPVTTKSAPAAAPEQITTDNHDNILSLNRTLLTLQSAIVAVSASLDHQHVIDTLLWEMVHLIQAENCIAFTWNQESNNISFRDTYKELAQIQPDLAYSLHSLPLFRRAIIDRIPVQLIAEELQPTLREHELLHTSGMQTLLLLPMVYHEQVLGLIGLVETRKKRVFSDWEVSLAQMLASQAASSIVNAQLYEEIDEANRALQFSNQELDAFAHTVAHDLKSPLGLVIGFADMLLTGVDNMPQEERAEYLEIISGSSKKMAEIINALLLLSTVRKADVQKTMVNMTACCREARHQIELQYKDREFEIIVPETLPLCWGYADWIMEVWTNYLSNGIKYGGHPARIEVGATLQEDGMVRYWVRDNGQGLTPEQQAKLFSPFTRLNQVSVAGHGLGLSIVRRIVEKLDGQVGIESELGQGSTFYFTLPRSSAFSPSINP